MEMTEKEEKMLSKWEFIEKKCLELGAVKCAGIAKNIEQILKKQYGDTKTEGWINEYEETERTHEDLENIRNLAETVSSCIACVKSTEDCGDSGSRCNYCKFADIAGGCTEKKSLFADFIRCLENEIAVVYEGFR